MVQISPSQPNLKSHYWMLWALLTLSCFLNFYNLDFGGQLHGDEPKKVGFILNGNQDFRHPVLMLQTARVLNSIFGFESADRLILLCRSISAFFGVLIILFTYLLAREILEKKAALFAALAVSVSPIMVVHSHYFKEDMIFTAFSLLSIICFLKFLRQPTLGRNILWGLATGLAFSAQYKAVLLGALYFLIPFFWPKVDKRWLFKSIGIAFGVAFGVFVVVNFPIFLHPEKFFEGVNHEAGHLIRGHRLKIHAIPQSFSFHLLHSIAPGISWGLTLLALGGWVHTAAKWKETSSVEKLYFLYVTIFYFSNEIIPLKPFPDFMRYMIPVVPLLMIFSCRFIHFIESWIKAAFRMRTTRSLSLPLMLLLLLWPLYDSILLDYHLTRDTRIKSQEWVESSGKRVLYGRYTNNFNLNGDFRTILDVDITGAKKSGIEYLLVSSFVYDRYLKGGKLRGQNQRVYELYEKYGRLFSQPYIEIKPEHKSFAFSNPVIRIVDIRGWTEAFKKKGSE
jgi:4-amino-4-deoxy-L-arabinose transferase-like glycosyltransferase